MRRKPILLIGDRGAVLYGSRENFFAPAPDTPEATRLAEALLAGKRAQPLILADFAALEFKRETLPKLGPFDRNRLLQRRLQIAFKKPQITGWQKLESVGAGQPYMFAAVGEYCPLAPWLEWLGQFSAGPVPIALLPLEGVRHANRLAAIEGGGSQWHMLVSWQQASGMRQIVTHNGKLVFTRLVGDIPDAASIEGDALQHHIRASFEYLGRLGLADPAQLHMSVIAQVTCHASLADMLGNAGRFTPGGISFYTPAKAAQHLKFSVRAGDHERFSDALFVARLQTGAEPAITMLHPAQVKARKAANAFRLAQTAAAAGILLLMSLGVVFGHAAWRHEDAVARKLAAIEALRQQDGGKESEADPAMRRLMQIRDVSRLQQMLASEPPGPWTLLNTMAEAMGARFRLNRLEWRAGETAADLRALTPGLTPGDATRQFRDFAGLLQQALPGHTVKLAALPLAALPEQTLQSGLRADPAASTARLVIAARQETP
ncbi:MAG: hypothetical protein GC131_04915 [Alphaproteobacteria bacterium]|nr:hypothetical protein [Alphaproteobacteria bacterium]